MKSPLSLRLSFLFFFFSPAWTSFPKSAGFSMTMARVASSPLTLLAVKSLMMSAIVQYFERSQFHAQAIRRGEKREREKERESEVPDNVSLSGHWCWTRTAPKYALMRRLICLARRTVIFFCNIVYCVNVITASFVISSPRIHARQRIKRLIAYAEC